MDFGDADDLEALMIQREALRAHADPRLADCEARIRTVAARQGLAEDELAAIEAQVLREGRHGPLAAADSGSAPFAGEYRIVAYGRWIALGIAMLLGLIIAAMGRPLVGVALMALAALIAFGRKRVRRFVVDDKGELYLGSSTAGALDWQRVRQLRLQRVEPSWATSLSKAAHARLEIVLNMVDGKEVHFGWGMYFQQAPVQRFIDLVFVRRYFEAECRRRGFSVEATPHGFIAKRSLLP